MIFWTAIRVSLFEKVGSRGQQKYVHILYEYSMVLVAPVYPDCFWLMIILDVKCMALGIHFFSHKDDIEQYHQSPPKSSEICSNSEKQGGMATTYEGFDL